MFHQDQLIQTYEMAERSLGELASLSDHSKAPESIERLRSVVSSFLHLSSFFLSSSNSHSHTRMHSGLAATDSSKVQELRLHLFQTISSLVLEQWSHSATIVLTLTPCLFELFNGAQAHDSITSDSPSNQQIVSLGKLLFMLSKESANDAEFCNVQYVEAALSVISKACGAMHNSTTRDRKPRHHRDNSSDVVQIDRLTLAFPTKMLIYVAGTLKNTSSAEEKMLKLLATNGAIATLSDTMRWRSSDQQQNKEIAQFLIQTTGVLRNLSVAKSYHKQFIEAQVPSRLCTMIPAFIGHLELMGNVSRILSKLTLHELPRAQINQQMAANLCNLMAVVDCSQNKSLSFLDQQQQQQQKSENRFQDILLIRMFFVLGNLCAGNDRNRLFIALDCDGIHVLLQTLQFYASQYVKQREHDNDNTSGDQHAADDEAQDGGDASSGSQQSGEVLVKLVRLLANLAINAEVGASLNRENAQMSALLETLDQAQRVGDEELMLNIVSCITNLSYYSPSTASSSSSSPVASSSTILHQSRNSFIEGNRIEITSLLSQILLNRNEEAVVEATRAFGNLTRFKDVLCFMSERKVLDCFVVLLDHSNREIVYTVCGVLMNAALDESTRQQLLRVRPDSSSSNDVRTLLLGIVECAAADDIDMTCIACKVLYNLLLANGTPRSGSIGDFDSEALHGVVQQIIKTMDAQDARSGGNRQPHVNQKSPASRKNRGTRHDDNGSNDDEANDEDDGDGQSSSWRELRLVLPQLLRGAAR